MQQSFLTFFLIGSSPYFYNAYALKKNKQKNKNNKKPLTKHSSKLQGDNGELNQSHHQGCIWLGNISGLVLIHAAPPSH